MELYRFISFEDFVNLFCNKKDKFINPFSWDDKYEGCLYSWMENEDSLREIVKGMYYNLSPRNYNAISDNFFRLWNSKLFSYAQCWTSTDESDAMWRCYAYDNKAIRIHTSDDKLKAHAHEIFGEDQYRVNFKRVEYDLDTKQDMIDFLIRQIKNSLSPHEPFFHKRKVFEHENEYRLLITDRCAETAVGIASAGVKSKIEKLASVGNDEDIINGLTELIYNSKYEKSEEYNKKALLMPTEDVNSYIKDVMVHPMAKKWFAEIVEDICSSAKVSFKGISQMYKLQVNGNER